MTNSQSKPESNQGLNSTRNPLLSFNLRPHNSLDERVVYKLMICLAVVMAFPVFISSKFSLFIAIAPFYALTLILFFVMVKSNFRSRKYYETVTIWPNLIEINRYENNGDVRSWTANPFWTRVKLYPTNQKVENYLTLVSKGKEVELGSFLAPTERVQLKQKIETTISNI